MLADYSSHSIYYAIIQTHVFINLHHLRLPTPSNLLENDVCSVRQTGSGQGGPKKRSVIISNEDSPSPQDSLVITLSLKS